ncbi:MAG TPA: O-methyltransferase [Bacilli bacterium]|nr:O-methyltransferase [Bacilli bacterium]
MDRYEYARQLFVQEDEQLVHTREATVERGMPAINVKPDLGKLLHLLVKIAGARDILEIGALGGYSGIWLARALPEGGTLTSLEIEEEYANFAQSNLERAGLGDKVSYRVGHALESLKQLEAEGRRFDLFFIDADKDNYPHYLESAIRLSNPGALIIGDNVLRGDRVLDPSNTAPDVEGIRVFNRRLAEDERLESILLPLHDGLSIARVK